MKQRISAWLLALILAALSVLPVQAAGRENGETVTVLFTHDLHSHFLPQTAEDGGKAADMPA